MKNEERNKQQKNKMCNQATPTARPIDETRRREIKMTKEEEERMNELIVCIHFFFSCCSFICCRFFASPITARRSISIFIKNERERASETSENEKKESSKTSRRSEVFFSLLLILFETSQFVRENEKETKQEIVLLCSSLIKSDLQLNSIN